MGRPRLGGYRHRPVLLQGLVLLLALVLLQAAGTAAADEAAAGVADEAVIERDQVVLRPLGGARFEVVRLVRVAFAAGGEGTALVLPLGPGSEDLRLMQGFDDAGWTAQAQHEGLAAAGPAAADQHHDFVYAYETSLATVRETGPGDWVPGPPRFLWQTAYAYPVHGLQVLTPVELFQAATGGEELGALGPVEVAGLHFDIWQLTGQPAGSFTLELIPAVPGGGGSAPGITGLSGASHPLAQVAGAWPYLAALVAGLAVSLAWLAWRLRHKPAGGGISAPAAARQAELVARIARLDLAAEAGELDPALYHQERRLLVQEARQLAGEGGP